MDSGPAASVFRSLIALPVYGTLATTGVGSVPPECFFGNTRAKTANPLDCADIS